MSEQMNECNTVHPNTTSHTFNQCVLSLDTSQYRLELPDDICDRTAAVAAFVAAPRTCSLRMNSDVNSCWAFAKLAPELR